MPTRQKYRFGHPKLDMSTRLGRRPSVGIPAILTFQTTSRYFEGDIDVSGTPTITWTFEDHGVETVAAPGLIDFGSTGLRTHTLVVNPWTDVTQIDFDMGAQIAVLTGVIDARMMPNLTDIDMDGFDIFNKGSLTTLKLNGLTSLADVDAADQEITNAGLQGVEDLAALITFDVDNNNFTQVPAIPSAAKPNMTRLVLHRNPITSIDLTGFDATLGNLTFGGGGQPTSMPSLSGVTGINSRLMIRDSGIVTGTIPGAILNNAPTFQIIRNASMANLTLGAHTASLFKEMYLNGFSGWTLDAILLQHKNIPSLAHYIHLLDSGIPSDTGMGDAVACAVNGGMAFVEAPDVNFTGLTEVDPNSRITVNSASKYTVAGMDRSEAAHLYQDLGAGNIGGDVIARGTFTIDSASTNGGVVALLCLSNTLDDVAGAEAADARVLSVMLDWNGTRADLWIRYNGTGGSASSPSLGTTNVINADQAWQWILVKADDEGSFGAAYLIVDHVFQPEFEDYWFTSIGQAAVKVVFPERVDHRYAMALNSMGDAGGGVMHFECDDYELWTAGDPFPGWVEDDVGNDISYSPDINTLFADINIVTGFQANDSTAHALNALGTGDWEIRFSMGEYDDTSSEYTFVGVADASKPWMGGAGSLLDDGDNYALFRMRNASGFMGMSFQVSETRTQNCYTGNGDKSRPNRWYIKMWRDGDTIYCEVYDDPNYTTLLGTQGISTGWAGVSFDRILITNQDLSGTSNQDTDIQFEYMNPQVF